MDNLIDDIGALKDELKEVKQGFEDNAPAEVQEKLFDRIKAWGKSNIETLALKKGDVAPDFCLPDANGELLSLVDLRSRGPVVVIFFRGSWCSFCNATLRMMRKYSPHFKARNATVVAISPLSVEETAKTAKENGLNFPVLSDTNSEYSQLLNIAFVLDDTLFDITPNLAELNGDESNILPIPATYVIETDGRVTYSFVETDFTQRAEPVDILNALPPLKKNRRKTLNEKIQFEIAKLYDTVPEHQMAAVRDDIDRIKTANVSYRALRVGNKAPDFKLLSSRDDEILFDSRRLRKHGPLIITFYHGPESPICNLALAAMQKYKTRFEAKGATIVAIAPPSKISKTNQASFTSFPLLIDVDNKVAKSFGIANLIEGLFRTEAVNEKQVLPLAATFVVNRSGRIVYSFVDEDHLTQRAEPLSILKAIPLERPKYSLKTGPFSFLANTRLAPRTWRKVAAPS